MNKFIEFLEKILKFLSGKKALLATVLGAIEAYLATKGIIGEAEVILISTILGAIFGTASYFTGRMYERINGVK